MSTVKHKALTAVAIPAVFILYSAAAQAQGSQPSSTPEGATEAVSEEVIAGKQADAFYDEDAMRESREELKKMLGNRKTGSVLFNQLETQFNDGSEDLYWNGQAWYGTDKNKLWFKSEGRGSLNSGKLDDAELQALWSRAISPFWNLQTGVRHDFKPKGLDYAVIGIQGLAPYWFEVDVSSYLSSKGDFTARAELEYDYRFTQRLILQPRVEANLSAQTVAERDIGSGLSSIDAGLRLRYEVRRQFAPYVGVEWQSNFGKTADIVKANGGKADQTVLVAGVRTWF